MKNKEKTSSLTYAAMMAAIFIVIHFIFPANRSIQGVVGAITPIPIAIYCFSNDYRKNIMFSMACLFLSLVFFDIIMVISFVVPNLILGVFLGIFLRKNFSWKKIFFLICLCIGFNIYEIYINYLITGINFIEVNILSINVGISTTQEWLPNTDKKILFDLNVGLLPLMFIVGGTLKTLIACYLTKIIIERLLGKKIEHKKLKYRLSSSIFVEVFVLSIYLITSIIWVLFLLNAIPYLFVYSILLDTTLFFAFLYYAVIHKKITRKFKKSKIMYCCISLLFVSIFFIISPIMAFKKIVNKGETHEEYT